MIPEDFPFVERRIPSGIEVLKQGERSRSLYLLVSGTVEIVKDGQRICEVSQKGALFGELSLLLDSGHNATVRTLKPCKMRILENGEVFLARMQSDPVLMRAILRMLAHRLSLLDSSYSELLAGKKGVNDREDDGLTEPLSGYWLKPTLWV